MVNLQMAGASRLRVHADGDVNAQDGTRFAPANDRLAGQTSQAILVLVELCPQLSAPTLCELRSQVQTQEHHWRVLGAVAVVGDSCCAFSTPLTNAAHSPAVRFFVRGEEARAEAWRGCASVAMVSVLAEFAPGMERRPR